MSDFDSKKIPVLRDVIDEEQSSIEQSKSGKQEEENLDLFIPEVKHQQDSGEGDESSLSAFSAIDEGEEHIDVHVSGAELNAGDDITIDSQHYDDRLEIAFGAAATKLAEDTETSVTRQADEDHVDEAPTAPPLLDESQIVTLTDEVQEDAAPEDEFRDTPELPDSTHHDDSEAADEYEPGHEEPVDEYPLDEEPLDEEAVDEYPLDEEPGDEETGVIESALVGYHHDDPHSGPTADTSEVTPVAPPPSEAPAPEVTATQKIQLQPLVNDIVKELLPDLEQQLRFLVRQALEDRLPEDLIDKEDS